MIKSLIRRISPPICKKQLNVTIEQCGNKYGGFGVAPDFIKSKNPIVYSFGVGEDISFDKAVIEKYGAEVFAFDPTPKSIKWIEQQVLSESYHFYPYGLSYRDGTEKFYLPKNDAYVSGSAIKMNNLIGEAMDVPMKKFASIANELGHKKIDILKMDIEGMEYDVMPQIMNSNIIIDQICIEIHGRMIKNGRQKSHDLIKLLQKCGYLVVHIADIESEITFIHKYKKN